MSNSGDSTSFALQTSSHCLNPQGIPIPQGPWEISSAPSEVTQPRKGLPAAEKQGWYGAEEEASENPAFYLWAREEEQMRRSSSMRCQLAFSRRKSLAGDTTNTMLTRNVMLRALPSVEISGCVAHSSSDSSLVSNKDSSHLWGRRPILTTYLSHLKQPSCRRVSECGILIEGGCMSSREPHHLSVGNR